MTHEYLDSVVGEIQFFRLLLQYRLIGIDRHFQMIQFYSSLLQSIARTAASEHPLSSVSSDAQAAAGDALPVVTVEDCWTKYKECYDQQVIQATVSDKEPTCSPADPTR